MDVGVSQLEIELWCIRCTADSLPQLHLQPREADVDELLGVQAAVPVLARRHGLGQHHASRVRRLPDAPQVHSPRDLLHSQYSSVLDITSAPACVPAWIACTAGAGMCHLQCLHNQSCMNMRIEHVAGLHQRGLCTHML